MIKNSVHRFLRGALRLLGRGGAPVPRHARRNRIWLSVSVLFVVLGVGAAALAAGAAVRADNAKSRASFARSSADIAASVKLDLQHENDLVVNTGGYLAATPNGSEAGFLRWSASVQLLAHYPEVQGIGALNLVAQSRLPAFAAQQAADPSAGSIGAGPFTLSPAGKRDFYCLTSVAQNRSPVTASPAGLDYCAGANGAALLAARDSGKGSLTPYKVGTQTWLGVQTPIYSGGTTPTTVAGRIAKFVGWVGTEVDPAVLLRSALLKHPGMSVSMRYSSASSRAVFASAAQVAGPHTVAIPLGDGWTVRASGRVVTGGIFTDANALRVLLPGALLSLLIGILVFVLGTSRERARRLVAERTRELHHQALHDSLTGLPNRGLVNDRIDQLLARNRRHGTSGAALFLDVDNFKNINDSLGHQAGDQLLIAVAQRLAGALRDADTIARMGGDEFVVLIGDADLDVAPELVAERLLAVMTQPFHLDATTMPLIVSVSIGVAVGDRANAGDLLRDADVALYQAKANGKNRYEIFDTHMQTRTSRLLDLEFDLRSALADDQFRLVYQPMYDLDDLTMIGTEALIRWDHPRRGLIGPDEFIPILEQTSAICEVGRWVLAEACRQTAAWHARGYALDISVNVSGRQLDDDAIIDDVRSALEAHGLPASSLIIEVTESALMRDADATAQRLHAIKALGVRIAVDDFGTGYSSLAYLRRFPVDSLKIDRMFTNAIAGSPQSQALICTLVQLGKDLGLTTLAEGVETIHEMDLLRSAHVNHAQGFLLSRPLEPRALEAELLSAVRSSEVSEPA